MFVLTYREESDAAYESRTTIVTTYQDAYEKMKTEYAAAKRELEASVRSQQSGEEEKEPNVNGFIQTDSAYLQTKQDHFRWEITEDAHFVTVDTAQDYLYTVTGVYHDLGTGNACHCMPVLCDSETAAQEALQQMYQRVLESYGLENNDAVNECDESVPGGYICEKEAGIYACADYADGCLVEVASFVIFAPKKNRKKKNQPVLGTFVSYWDGGVEITSFAEVDFETGCVTIVDAEAYPRNDTALEILEKERVYVKDEEYPVLEKDEYLELMADGEISKDGVDSEGQRVLWYQ